MRINTEREEVITSGKIEKTSQEYALSDEGGQLFSILSTSIYSNPIRAIIREVGTNAFDAHRDAGKSDVPFDVIMPTEFDSQIRFRDYGNGMSYDQVFSIFRVYGASTKSGSSEDVGGFGIGSKSPFAYTSSFFVKSYQNGVMNVYENVMQVNGKPKLSHIVERETDQPDGMEISFNVESGDLYKFQSEIEYVFSFFPVTPNVMNMDFEPAFDTDSLEKVSDKTYRFRNRPSEMPSAKAYVRMGCVVYPIRDSEEIEDIMDRSFLINHGSGYLFFDFDVDEVQVRPTREDLLYTDDTITKLKRYLNKADSGIRQKMATRFKELRSMSPMELVKTQEFTTIDRGHYGDDHQTRYIRNKFVAKISRMDGTNVFCKLSNLRPALTQAASADMTYLVGAKNADGETIRINPLCCFRAVPFRHISSTSKGVAWYHADATEVALKLNSGAEGTVYFEKRGCQKLIKTCEPAAEDSPVDFKNGYVVIFKKDDQYAEHAKAVIEHYFGDNIVFEKLPAMSTAKAKSTGQLFTLHKSTLEYTAWTSGTMRDTLKFSSADDLLEQASLFACRSHYRSGKIGKVLFQQMAHNQPVYDILPTELMKKKPHEKLVNDFDNRTIVLAQKKILKDFKSDNRFQSFEGAFIGRLLSYKIPKVNVVSLAMRDFDQLTRSMVKDKKVFGILMQGVMDKKSAKEGDLSSWREFSNQLDLMRKIVRTFKHRIKHNPSWFYKNREVICKLRNKYAEMVKYYKDVERQAQVVVNRVETRKRAIFKCYPLLELISWTALTDSKYIEELRKYVFGKE